MHEPGIYCTIDRFLFYTKGKCPYITKWSTCFANHNPKTIELIKQAAIDQARLHIMLHAVSPCQHYAILETSVACRGMMGSQQGLCGWQRVAGNGTDLSGEESADEEAG